MNKISQIYSTIFFIGYIRWFPGTIGSFVSIIVIFQLQKVLDQIEFIALFIFLSLISLILIGIYSKNISQHDSKEIIIDEFLGIYLIMIFWDYYNSTNFFFNLFMIFILFRLFDIFKPFPIKWIDINLKNSFGVIFDDIIAGIYSIIILFLFNAII